MMKFFKKYSWFFIITLQVLIGTSAGMLTLSSIKADAVSVGTRIGDLSVSGLPFSEAKAAISTYYGDIAQKGALTLEIDKKTFKLAYSDFDASIDIDGTMENLTKSARQSGLDKLIGESASQAFKPVFSYNSGKLLSMCEKIFSAYEREPVHEHYEINQGNLKYIPQVSGAKVDYKLLELELKDRMFDTSRQIYAVDTKKTALFSETRADGIYKEQFKELVSKATVKLEPNMADKAAAIIKPIQGSVFLKGQKIDLGSFIDFTKFTGDMDKDLLNRISTALYQAVLPIDGINVINRKPSLHAVAYAEPGLEAVIEGTGANLVLKNDTDRSLMVLADIKNDSITFYAASTGDIKSGILIVQKKDMVQPPVITSVNKDISPNEKKVISEGIPGYTVYVSRLIDDDRTELYHDKYQPVSKILETGDKPVLSSDK